MADSNILGFTIVIDGVPKTVQSLDEIKSHITDLKKQATGLDLGSEAYKKAQTDIKNVTDQYKTLVKEAKTKELGAQFSQLGTDIGSSFEVAETSMGSFGAKASTLSSESGDAIGVLKDKIYGLVPGLKSAESGVASFSTSLKALMANPIILMITGIVAALGLLYEAFTYSVAGAKKMEQVFAGLKAGFDVVIDRLAMAGQAIIKFFSGDFTGAAAQMKASFTGVGDAIAKAGSETAKATEELQKLAKAQRESSVERAAQNAQIVKSRELLNDETASIADKKKALAEVSAFEKKIGQEDVARAKEILKQKLIIWGQTSEGLKKHAQDIADLQIEISNKEEETARKTIAIQRQGRNLQRQEVASLKDKGKAEEDARNATINQINEQRAKIKEIQNKYDIDQIKDADAKAIALLKSQQETARQEILNEIDKLNRKKSLTAEEIKLKQTFNERLKVLQKTQAEDLIVLEETQAKAKKEKQDAYDKQLLALQESYKNASIKNTLEKAEAELETMHKAAITAINLQKITEEEKAKLIQAQTLVTEQKRSELIKTAIQTRQNFELSIMNDGVAKKLKAIDLETAAKIAQARTIYANEKEFAAKSVEITKDAEEKKQKINELALLAKIDAEAQTLGQVAALFGQNTAAFKGLKVAETTMTTYSSAVKAYDSMVDIPVVGTILAPIAAAAAVASGLESVAKILSVDTTNNAAATMASNKNVSKFASGGYVTGPGTGTSDSIPAMLSRGESVINANSTAMFGGLLSQINQMGGGQAFPQQHIHHNSPAPIIKTYVVASEMTSQQEADKKIKNIAKI